MSRTPWHTAFHQLLLTLGIFSWIHPQASLLLGPPLTERCVNAISYYFMWLCLLQSLFSGILRIFVRVSDPSSSSDPLEVIITVVDINDNSPMFENLPFSLSIAEVSNLNFVTCLEVWYAILQNSNVGTSVYQARAADEDLSRNAAILYSLVVKHYPIIIIMHISFQWWWPVIAKWDIFHWPIKWRYHTNTVAGFW